MIAEFDYLASRDDGPVFRSVGALVYDEKHRLYLRERRVEGQQPTLTYTLHKRHILADSLTHYQRAIFQEIRKLKPSRKAWEIEEAPPSFILRTELGAGKVELTRFFVSQLRGALLSDGAVTPYSLAQIEDILAHDAYRFDKDFTTTLAKLDGYFSKPL